MSEIIDGLYLGGYKDAESLSNMMSMVVNCTTTVPFYNENTVNIRLKIEDNGEPSESKKLYDSIEDGRLFEQIDHDLKRGKRVLVHCVAGRQRSAALVACFVVWKYKVDPYQAIGYVQGRRREAFFGGANFMDTIVHFYKNEG